MQEIWLSRLGARWRNAGPTTIQNEAADLTISLLSEGEEPKIDKQMPKERIAPRPYSSTSSFFRKDAPIPVISSTRTIASFPSFTVWIPDFEGTRQDGRHVPRQLQMIWVRTRRRQKMGRLFTMI